MRNKLGWSQDQLADAAKLTQGAISRAQNPNYGNLTFNTVLRIAAGLDVAVIIEFVSFSKLLQVFENRSEDSAPVTFEEEDKAFAAAAVTQRLLGEQVGPAASSNPMQTGSEIEKILTRQRENTLIDKLGAPKEPSGVRGALTAPPQSILGYAN